MGHYLKVETVFSMELYTETERKTWLGGADNRNKWNPEDQWQRLWSSLSNMPLIVVGLGCNDLQLDCLVVAGYLFINFCQRTSRRQVILIKSWEKQRHGYHWTWYEFALTSASWAPKSPSACHLTKLQNYTGLVTCTQHCWWVITTQRKIYWYYLCKISIDVTK